MVLISVILIKYTKGDNSMEKQLEELFESIILDDLVVFSRIINENESYLKTQFGRFPLLSVCYLFHAKHILKHYEKKLIAVDDFILTNEPVRLTKEFIKQSGKCLRLFLNNQTVYPLEMLAILGMDSKVKKLYKLCKTGSQYNNLCKNIYSIIEIYKIKGQMAEFYKNSIKIHRKKLDFWEKKSLKKYSVIFSCFIVLIISAFLVISQTLGLGIPISYMSINTESQFQKIFGQNGYYNLTNDITISKNSLGDFSGQLNGNNHTISITNSAVSQLFSNNNGVIKNLKFVIKCENESQLSQTTSLLCGTNNGSLQNISIEFTSQKVDIFKNNTNSVDLIGFSKVNNGKIENCKIKFNTTAFGNNENGDSYIAGFVGQNFGKISNCIVESGSEIESHDIDVVGICIDNQQTGNILNSKNYGNFSQTNNIVSWSPTVSGIAINNYGSIESCNNFGKLKINSTSTETGDYGCYMAGITIHNYNSVNKCLNKSSLIVESKQKNALVGGIVSLNAVDENSISMPNIKNCGSQTAFDINVTLNETSQNLSFIGGIIASSGVFSINNLINGSFLTNNYSDSNYTINQSKTIFTGLVVGVVNINEIANLVIFNEITNNFVTKTDNIEFQFGYGIGIYYNSRFNSFNLNQSSAISIVSKQDLLNKGVYFDEN